MEYRPNIVIELDGNPFPNRRSERIQENAVWSCRNDKAERDGLYRYPPG
jgi:hypothetical protein